MSHLSATEGDFLRSLSKPATAQRIGTWLCPARRHALQTRRIPSSSTVLSVTSKATRSRSRIKSSSEKEWGRCCCLGNPWPGKRIPRAARFKVSTLKSSVHWELRAKPRFKATAVEGEQGLDASPSCLPVCMICLPACRSAATRTHAQLAPWQPGHHPRHPS